MATPEGASSLGVTRIRHDWWRLADGLETKADVPQTLTPPRSGELLPRHHLGGRAGCVQGWSGSLLPPAVQL